jgi:general secretion pathway protein K
MKISMSSSPRGIALVVVMVAIFVLAILTGGFAYSMKVEMRLAMNANHDGELLWLGRSGVERARWILAQQLSVPNEPYDSLNQKWAGGPGDLAESNSPLSDVSLDNYQIGDGAISIKITDQERKFNINIADQSVLQKALILMGANASDTPTVVDSILDWIDPDDNPRMNGAESDYYQSLNPPYYSKNRPIDDLSELLLVRGIRDDPALYWGGASSNHPPAFFQKLSPSGTAEATSYSAGLVDLFTPISSGKLNINTASQTTLQLIPGVDESTAAQIIRVRAGPDGVDGTEDDTPFQSVAELATVGLNNAAAQQLGRYCDVRSHVFQVEVIADIGGYKRHFFAILGRNNQRDIQILSFYWKDQ